MALLTITLNPAIDKVYTVPGFAVDCVQRPTETRVFAGGKGVNVARVYQTLGGSVAATGFLGGRSGEYICQSVHQEGIAAEFVQVQHESRVCTVVIDPVGRTETVLNETGPQVTPEDCTALLLHLWELLPGIDCVVLSGSAPPGVPIAIYGEIIRLAQDEFGVEVILDASGEALQEGVAARPFLVKPNVYELTALSVGSDGWGGSAQALREQYGVTLALVTGGSRGAVLASADGIWEAAPPPIEFLSAIGSGDSLTGAFVWAWEQGHGPVGSLKLGVAAGAANATVYGSGTCSREQIFELASRTIVNKTG